MPPVPSACQSLADQVATLEQQYTAVAGQAAASTGSAAWADLARAGTVLEQLTAVRASLDQCVKTHSAALTGTVVVIDVSGSSGIGEQTATLWDLTAGGAVAHELTTVQAGAFGFQGPLPGEAAITLRSGDGSDTVTGLDFRSGQLPAPIDGQTPRLEIVVAPAITIPAQRLKDLAAAVNPISQALSTPPGFPLAPAQATITTVTTTLSSGVVTVGASGSLTGTLLGTPLPAIPASADVSLALTPSSSPQTDEIIHVSLAGSNPITVEINSPLLSGVANLVIPLFSSFIGNLIQQTVNDLLHQLLSPATAQGLALPALPPATTVSLRTLAIDEQGITFQPALGTVGTALSSFKPSPLPAP